ncbi:MAG: periplasmic heavy metal sensor [Candidatus Cloacimonadaceae bacterium]|nr:periplasmic heavy metal sensor [Candidatus Cloacimonadaceae bacterium]
MNKRWLVILLLISASFNLAVLGGFLYVHSIRPCPMDRLGPPPGPPHGQGGGFPPHKMGWKFFDDDSVKALREEFGATKKQLMDEIAKDPLDEERINSIIESSLTAQIKLEREMGRRLIQMRKEMSAEEAREFFTKRGEEMQQRRNYKPYKSRRLRP